MEPIISLQNVAIRYKLHSGLFRPKKYFDALKSVSLDIYPGETLGVLGRNGSGKSTLLRVITGVLRPDKGKIINRGVNVSLLALQAGFDQNLSGRDNAIFRGMLLGYSRRDAVACLDEIQEYSELGDFFFEPVRTYSSGMSARLGFSISIINSPDVILLDEVLSVGDQHFKQKAERTMMSMIQSEQTVVLVSHSHHQVARLCDRAVLIDNGISYATGKPKDVLKIYEEGLRKLDL